MTQRRFVGMISSAFVVGLSSALAADAAVVPHHQVGQRQGGWMAKDANPRHAWLYVSGQDNSIVSIYDLERVGAPEIGHISDGLSEPLGVTVDAGGTLYVANARGGDVTIYPAGQTKSSLTLSRGLDEPISVGVDAPGNVYVCNRGATPSIVVYPPGQTIPSATITGALIQIPTALTFDAAGNMFYSDNSTAVSEMAVGSQQLVSLGLKGLTYTSGLGIDTLSGELFVSQAGSGSTLVFRSGDVNPVRTLKDSQDVDLPVVGKVKSQEYAFLPGSSTNEVSLYGVRGRNTIGTIATDAESAAGVAFKPAGIP
jgi:hypothetical protein